jgi:hypothetical protein
MKTSALGVVAVIGSSVVGCGSTEAVVVTLSDWSFGTSGGNLFNCSTPAAPANRNGLSSTQVGCQPTLNSDGSYATTPVVVSEQLGCGDGHGAVVTVTCAGSGTGKSVVGTVALSISASCGSSDMGGATAGFQFQDLGPGTTQTSPAPVSSCAVFDDLCNASDACAFNDFTATVTVENVAR